MAKRVVVGSCGRGGPFLDTLAEPIAAGGVGEADYTPILLAAQRVIIAHQPPTNSVAAPIPVPRSPGRARRDPTAPDAASPPNTAARSAL
ncbi:MAG: hypothetical protein QJR12_04810 [Mycobacterium sp.]|uniref:hypothetical protein n=1 Tax=Mycobacterium sp. TaxID=1785 RepID=UPI002605BBD7|nr:hypothetical protein [Mycobacterium sp.]MDI3313617.1 hypothetical protein [Mycobacterium sp.]